MESFAPTYLRCKNRDVVYRLLVQHKNLSKADIAKKTSLTFPTVSKVIMDFSRIGLVSETELAITSENGLGRKGKIVHLEKNSYSTIGIFFEGNRLHIGLINLCHEVIDQVYFPLLKDPTTPDDYLHISSKMTDAVYSLEKSHPETKILGVGIGMPGVVDTEGKTFRRWGKLYDFKEFYKTFDDSFPYPVFIENDMNAASLGEIMLRGDSCNGNLIYLSLGTGTGAGIIINNQIWHGDAYLAGDIGMALLGFENDIYPENLEPLRLNNMINANAIKNRFGVNIQQDEPCSEELKEEISQYVTRRILPLLYNFTYMFDIRNIVLSGSVTEYLGHHIFDCLDSVLTHMQIVDNIQLGLKIIPSISQDSGIIGAADIALERCRNSLLS